MVGAGPDFKKGKTIGAGLQSIDVCPTACELLGVKPEFANGKVMREILA